MAAHPRHHLDAALQDERVDLHEVGVGERQHLAVAVQPRVHQVGDVIAVLDERQRAGQVVQVPAEAEIVEVDDLDHVALDDDVRIA